MEFENNGEWWWSSIKPDTYLLEMMPKTKHVYKVISVIPEPPEDEGYAELTMEGRYGVLYWIYLYPVQDHHWRRWKRCNSKGEVEDV